MDPVASLQALNDAVMPGLYIFGVSALIVETLVLAVRKIPRDVRSRRLSILSGALGFGVAGLFHATALYAVQLWVYDHRVVDLGFGPTAFVVCLLVNDLMFYVSHRAMHEVRLLWAVHVVHHSATHYDLTTGVRGSALGAIAQAPFVVWIPLLGIHPIVFLICDSAFKFYGLAYHTEALGKLGPLDDVLVTPSNHRVHHASDHRYLDQNYGGLFIVFDRLFGTFTREDETPRYGLTTPIRGESLLEVQTHELVALARDMRAAPSLHAALGYALRPPGWQPDGRGRTAAQLRAAARGEG